MANLIIRNAADLAEYFDNVPSIPKIGRQSSYSIIDELSSPRQATGYTTIQRAAERINARGENLRVDEIINQSNWDLI